MRSETAGGKESAEPQSCGGDRRRLCDGGVEARGADVEWPSPSRKARHQSRLRARSPRGKTILNRFLTPSVSLRYSRRARLIAARSRSPKAPTPGELAAEQTERVAPTPGSEAKPRVLKLLIHRKRSPFPHKGRLSVPEPAGEKAVSFAD